MTSTAWVVGVQYQTGGVIYEDLAVVLKSTKPTKREMACIFHARSRAQSFNNVVGFNVAKLPVVEVK